MNFYRDFWQPMLLVHGAAFCQTISVCLFMTSWSTAKSVRDRPMISVGRL